MDLDERLSATTLPDPQVDTATALDRTLGRGRAHRRLRRVAAGAGLAAVLALVAGIAVLATEGDGDEDLATTPTSAPPTDGPAGSTPPAEPEAGDDAVWWTDPARPPSPTDTSVAVLVTRLGCAGG